MATWVIVSVESPLKLSIHNTGSYSIKKYFYKYVSFCLHIIITIAEFNYTNSVKFG